MTVRGMKITTTTTHHTVKIHRREERRRFEDDFIDRRLFPRRVNEKLLAQGTALSGRRKRLCPSGRSKEMNHGQGMQVSTPSLALSVCLPAMFIIRNLLGLPKLACPSLFLLLSVRRKDTIRRDRRSRSRDQRC